MNEPFLILHKVRGQPAFDIAERITIGEEEGWIIPTSGHRAYPYKSFYLEDVFDVPHTGQLADNWPIPADWPDHYSPKAEEPQPTLSSLLDRLGLLPKVRRRI